MFRKTDTAQQGSLLSSVFQYLKRVRQSDLQMKRHGKIFSISMLYAVLMKIYFQYYFLQIMVLQMLRSEH